MRIAFDCVKRRPGCAIVQRVLGADIPSDVLEKFFPSETWLVSPTDDMQVYPVTEGQLAQLSVMARAAVAPSSPAVSGDGGDDEPTRPSDC